MASHRISWAADVPVCPSHIDNTALRKYLAAMPVRKRLKVRGRSLVFVTTAVYDWLPVFSNKEAASIVLEQLRETMSHYEISLVGYVLMPSHLHALFGLPRYEQLSEFMQCFKSITSRKMKKLDLVNMNDRFYRDGRFRFWRPRFDDLIVISEKQLKTKLEYIHSNPVRAGLVENATDWSFSSAQNWHSEASGFLEIDKDFEWAL